ncbi:MAG: hypothetical protein KAJ75_08515, partial [Alphaproteobacteria bacterium]|nr:hypothetical protein [Alphaproteobacteria bacterium]
KLHINIFLMKTILLLKQGLAGQMNFDNDFSGKDIVEKICLTEDGKTYFTDDVKILEEGKFVDINHETKDFLTRFMEGRRKTFDLAPDKSLNEIPVLSKAKDKYTKEEVFPDKKASMTNAILNKAQWGR